MSNTLYTAEQIRQAEQVAIERCSISGWQMMQRAGQAAFDALRRYWPDRQRVSVFCGVGNNAGDGYVLARLALQAGYRVTLHALAPVDLLKGDALTAYRNFIEAGGLVFPFEPEQLIDADVIVDGLFGTGLSRVVSGIFQQAIKAINRSKLPVLAIDIPSGLHADTGNIMGCAIQADVTVSFVGLKRGLYTGKAADYCGDVVFDDLSLPSEVLTTLKPSARLNQPVSLAVRSRTAHKGHFGHLLLIGGNHGFNGAIRLAAEAALRSGAGLVSVATRSSHAAMLNIGCPELMVHAVESAVQLSPLLEKATTIAIGPGLGQDQWAQELLAMVLSSIKPSLLDADALNLLASQPCRRNTWVLTPHPGEAARLLNVTTADIGHDRFAALTELQYRFGGVCLLKGAGTLITDGDDLYVNTTGNPGMASGGMGDVLAGVIGGLLAQGLSPIAATCLAVHAHGAAADQLAHRDGERGLLASDLFPVIRRLLN